jgi:formylglycine-generating enzyme
MAFPPVATQAPRSFWAHPLLRSALALAALGLSAWGTLRFAFEERRSDRCPVGLVPQGGRCCGAGQTLVGATCTGPATTCSNAQQRDETGSCRAALGVISFSGGELHIGATDWDGASGGERFPRTRVAPFRLDATEVTLAQFGGDAAAPEPGLPVTNISPDEAEAYCRARHGRLPSAAEWVFAAAGSGGRRYPWGNSGLVCRRAAFGLVSGPCASQGASASADSAGSRPDGASPDGVQDLAGNVAEWTLEPDGSYAARGGSYRSTSAAELKSWAAVPGRDKALHIGFRCAYPL